LKITKHFYLSRYIPPFDDYVAGDILCDAFSWDL